MRETTFAIKHIPALLLGEESDRVYLYVHGKCSSKEGSRRFAETACARGWQVLSIDLPEHGDRQGEQDTFDPWHAVPELRTVMAYARQRWRRVALRATSMGAWFSMLAFGDQPPERALFVSPVLDMERLIGRMMGWAGVTEAALQERGRVETNFGETLSWDYLQYVRAHPIDTWACPTSILYAGQDHLTPRRDVDEFVERFGCELAVMEDGEHWFHTPEQLSVLDRWTEAHVPPEKPVTEVVAALIWDGDRFLACQRPANKARGLLWEFVGGKVEHGETREQALIRECREELGVTLSVGEAFTDVVHDYPDLTVHLTLFHAAIAQGVPQKLEHNDLRWLTVEEAGQYPFCPADQVFLERLKTLPAGPPRLSSTRSTTATEC